jgi:hypothetical protein
VSTSTAYAVSFLEDHAIVLAKTVEAYREDPDDAAAAEYWGARHASVLMAIEVLRAEARAS